MLMEQEVNSFTVVAAKNYGRKDMITNFWGLRSSFIYVVLVGGQGAGRTETECCAQAFYLRNINFVKSIFPQRISLSLIL